MNPNVDYVSVARSLLGAVAELNRDNRGADDVVTPRRVEASAADDTAAEAARAAEAGLR